MCAWPKPQFWEKHLVNQFGSGLNKRYRAYISTSCFLRERFDVDSEQFLRVLRVTEFLAEGCSQGLENLRVKETPMFVAETTRARTFSQTATEECCVKIMRIRTRFLVVSVLDICTSKTQKLCFLEPRTRTEGSFSLNSQKVVSYFVLSVVSHVDTLRFLWPKTVHQSAELSYLWLAAHLVFVKPKRCSFFQNEEACSTVCSD